MLNSLFSGLKQSSPLIRPGVLWAGNHIGTMVQSLYGFKATSLDGKEVDFSRYKGKVVLIENTASL